VNDVGSRFPQSKFPRFLRSANTDNGDRGAARAVLSEPCRWFRAGRATADVVSARTLLAELA
jgi:hypothetical protein